ncbi:MAG: DUF2786 domain-containing protein [Acidimicrobiales bacterium]|nr:DUF2786 domain-containing protein [Acidimicrobiales bacterium]
MTTHTTQLTAEEHSVLIAKVERLWRKARSTNFPAEAQAYEEKALYLMARARITQAMLDLDGKPDSIVDQKIGVHLAGGYRIPAETIFNAVCKAFGCRAYLYVSGRRSQPAAVGFSADLDRVKFLWPMLHSDAMRAAAELRGRTAAETSSLRRSSMYGYAEAITERFEAINRLASDDADNDPTTNRSPGSAGSALVVKGRDKLVDEHFKRLRISSRARRVSGGYGGHDHGRTAGMAADLSGGATTMKPSPSALTH